MKKIIIVGSGGHCRPVVATIIANDNFNILGIIDLDYKTDLNEKILGFNILGSLEKINQISSNNTSIFLAIGDNQLRENISKNSLIRKFQDTNIIHQNAVIDPSAKIGTQNYIGPFTHIGPEVEIGSYNIINTYSNIEHETKIGSFNQLAPGSTLCGRCKIGNNNFFGANSTIIQKISINNYNIIGAGSTIIDDVDSSQNVLVGVPGKKIK